MGKRRGPRYAKARKILRGGSDAVGPVPPPSDDEKYFEDLTERLPATGYDPYAGYVPKGEENPEGPAEWVRWARLAYAPFPDGALPVDRATAEKYLALLTKLRDFLAESGVGRTRFREGVVSELWFAGQAVRGLTADTGGALDRRTARGHGYDRAGRSLAATFEACGIKSPHAESALFLWHCGWRDAGIAVINPYGPRGSQWNRRGNLLESVAKKRFSRKGRLYAFGLSMARMMGYQAWRRGPPGNG